MDNMYKKFSLIHDELLHVWIAFKNLKPT